jgi:hypothetical protein
MKYQNRHSFVTDDQAVQMGADMAIQFMLMMLVVSEMADDPRACVWTFTRSSPS